jgi:hypothetical protein
VIFERLGLFVVICPVLPERFDPVPARFGIKPNAREHDAKRVNSILDRVHRHELRLAP